MGSVSHLRRALIAAVAVLSVAGCQPARPAAGRPGAPKTVALLGDSMSWGLFMSSPSVEGSVRPLLKRLGANFTMDGGPGGTPIVPWPGFEPWLPQLQRRINATNPDVVIIQSTLFDHAEDPANQQQYRETFTQMLDVAQSRGAHVYIVKHPPSQDPHERAGQVKAEEIQAEVAAGRGVETIPMDWWMSKCNSPFIKDGFHLSQSGANCWGLAIAAAVHQLR